MPKKVTKKVVNPKVPRTRNNGTMSESMFWSFIRSALRQKSRFWKPIQQCKMNSRRPYIGVNKRQKFEYQCNHCKGWFAEKEIAVDHIVEAGELRCAADLPGFVERLFTEEGFQVLCDTCHLVKSNEYRISKKTPKTDE